MYYSTFYVISETTTKQKLVQVEFGFGGKKTCVVDCRRVMNNSLKKRKVPFDNEIEPISADSGNKGTNETTNDLLKAVRAEHSYACNSPKIATGKITHLVKLLESECKKTKLLVQDVHRLKHQRYKQEKHKQLKQEMKSYHCKVVQEKLSETVQQIISLNKVNKVKQQPPLVKQFPVQ